jgi:hypothetical protein
MIKRLVKMSMLQARVMTCCVGVLLSTLHAVRWSSGASRCARPHAVHGKAREHATFRVLWCTVICAVYTLGTGAVAQAALGKKDASPKAELLLGTEDKVPAPSGPGFNSSNK